jgi:cytochrome c-type biogenesis protein CcsB
MKILFLNDYQLPVIGCFLLFFAMISYWISLSLPKNNIIFLISKLLVAASNVLFTLTLLVRWIGEGYFPLSNLYESLIFLSWGISLLHLLIEFKTKSRLIGSISTPILFFLSGFSSLTLPTDMQKALPLVPSLQSNWLMMHVSMMMISYATLILGSLLSILYLAFNVFNQKEKNLLIKIEKRLRVI